MTVDWTADLLLGAAALLGASVQRVVGIGFALVAAPGLVLLLGASQGVLLANCAGAVICAIGLASGWRQVRPVVMLPLVAAAVCTVPLGAWVAHRLPEPTLLVCMGALISAAVTLVISGTRVVMLGGTGGAVAAGAASGFMNSSAGVGGPALSLYALNADWPAREFVPNAHFYGLVVNICSLAVKGVPRLTVPAWMLAAAGIAAGAVIGKALASRLPEQRARRLVMALALLGGLTMLGKGLTAL